MKNKLFAAFLTFTAISCFATSMQPCDTELLVYLKTAKAEIELDLTGLSTTIQEMEKKHGQDYKRLETAITEFYNLLATDICDMDRMFTMICTQKKSIKTMTADGDFEPLFNTICIENHKQEIEPILNKYSNSDPFLQHTNTLPLESRLNNYFFTGDALMIFTVVVSREIYITLLQKINAKIAELEAQL